MALELRSRLGLDSNDRRFVDEEASNLPEDVSDPRTIRDESQPTLWEKFHSIRWYLFFAASFGIVFLLYLIAIGAAIVPDLLGNVVIQAGIVLLATFLTGYGLATRSALSRVRDIDWLVLIKPNGVDLYPGEFIPSGDDERYHKFQPYRGFSFFGHVKKPLTIGDVNPQIARRWKAARRDLDDPAVIRLDPDFGERTSTEYGQVLAQISNGLNVDTFGRQSFLEAALPDMADESRMDDLRQQIQTERENVRHYRQRAETYRSQRDEALEVAREPILDQVEDFVEIGERIADAGRPRRSESDNGDDVPPLDSDVESATAGVSGGE